MKQLFMVLLALASSQFIHAQSFLDLAFGASRTDYQHWNLRASTSVGDRWQLGIEFQAFDYRYRFIDARPVTDGFAGQVRGFTAFKIAESDRLRFDAFLKPGVRYIQAPDGPQPFDQYAFQNSWAVTVDPGLVVTWQAFDKLSLHTGVNARTVIQVQPLALAEQLPSSLILFGGIYALAPRWSLFAAGNTGPMNGASGDSQKYNWEASFGIRFSIATSPNNQFFLCH